MTKIDYENWEEHQDENLAASKEAVMLDIDGKINLEKPEEADEEDLPYKGAAAGNDGQPLLDVTDPGNALSNKDNVPSSGIVLNRNYLNDLKNRREATFENSVADEYYPEIVHFRLIDDLGDSSRAIELSEELADLYENLANLADTDGVPGDFDLYDGLIGDGACALALHVKIEDGALAEAYATLETGEAAADAPDFLDFGEGEVFDPASSDLVPDDESLQKAFANYITNVNPMNAETLPLSFLAYYLRSHSFSEWTEFLREAGREPGADFDRPMYVRAY